VRCEKGASPHPMHLQYDVSDLSNDLRETDHLPVSGRCGPGQACPSRQGELVNIRMFIFLLFY
jgi:hypothetical protein